MSDGDHNIAQEHRLALYCGIWLRPEFTYKDGGDAGDFWKIWADYAD
jgi:hypothetical protein